METLLDLTVHAYLQHGARLESRSATTAVLVLGQPVQHVLHLILSLLTAGIWLIVWALMVFSNKQQRIVLALRENGSVSRTVTTS